MKLEAEDNCDVLYPKEYQYWCDWVEKFYEKYPFVPKDIFYCDSNHVYDFVDVNGCSLNTHDFPISNLDDPNGCLQFLCSMTVGIMSFKYKAFSYCKSKITWDENISDERNVKVNIEDFFDNIDYDYDYHKCKTLKTMEANLDKTWTNLMDFYLNDWKPAYEAVFKHWVILQKERKKLYNLIRFRTSL